MLDCLLIGDSIALGTHLYRPDCVTYAKTGITSANWKKSYLESDMGDIYNAKTVIISLGSNDHKAVNTREEIATIRKNVKAKRVFWILPAIKPEVQDAVREIALGFGDTVLEIKKLQSDKVHPTLDGYKDIAERTK